MTSRSAICPVCDAEMSLAADAVVSELIVCSSCCVALEVKGLDPVLIEEAPQEEEDWGQ